ncbi:MAG: DUF11 domain-containing protein [Solirubrobacteraceae bacterium]|nr:DUF11 domain-containing protein [Solirubrobacteraceae bacterium]
MVTLLAVLLATLGAATAHAAAPEVQLTRDQPATVLFGDRATITLRASLASGDGYNLSFREVLPKGLSYVSGSSNPDPKQYPQPDGTTVLVWQNVADLTAGASHALTYEVAHGNAVAGDCPSFPGDAAPNGCDVGSTFSMTGTAFLDDRPRCVPQFDADGDYAPRVAGAGPCDDDAAHQGQSTASGSTDITAIEITKSEPSPEGELLRGLHDHQTVYTLKVRNNGNQRTEDLRVEDWLPANLEFLGCPAAGAPWIDNTTGGAHLSGTEEYPGAGPINPGNAPAAPDCLEPDSVETVELEAGNPQGLPAGVYTHVVWDDLGTLASGAEIDIRYVAAIPLRENVAFGDGAPTPASGEQAANLDNNTGPRTDERGGEQSVENHANAAGDYMRGGTDAMPVTDATSLVRTAEDLRIIKSVAPKGILVGGLSTWTLQIATGEYFDATTDLVVTDTLAGSAPNALCPIGHVPGSTTDALDDDCAPGGANPTPTITADGSTDDAPFAAGTTQNADGTWTLVWDESTVDGLAGLERSDTATIEFSTRTRETYYDDEGVAGGNVRTGDAWDNDVHIAGTVGADVLEDPDTPPTVIEDVSSAGQSAPVPSIAKAVSAPTAAGTPESCEDATGWAGATPTFGPGDVVCWRITATFPEGVFGGEPRITDFLPDDVDYVAAPTPTGYWLTSASDPDIAVKTFDASDAANGVLEWRLGSDGDHDTPVATAGAKTFEVIVATRIPQTPSRRPTDLVANLAKLRTSNTAAQTFPTRSDVDFEWAAPVVTLDKAITAPTDVTELKAGDTVQYSVKIANTGNREAEGITVWDRMPATVGGQALVCANITAVSDGGACALDGDGRPRIVWSGLDLDPGETQDLTYTFTVPTGIAAGTTIPNDAGVVRYEAPDNTGGTPTEYVPEDNIDPSREAGENAPPARDDEEISTAGLTFAKARTTEVGDDHNAASNEATVGERIDYTITATIPKGATVPDGTTVSDVIAAPTQRLVVAPGTPAPTATVAGDALTAGANPLPGGDATWTITDPVDGGGGAVAIAFPDGYEADPAADAQVVITLSTIVTNVAGNARDGSLTNAAALTGATTDPSTSTTTTRVVEPNLAVGKSSNAPSRVRPGDTVTYTISVDNQTGTRVSTAHDVTVVDTVPVGITPVTPIPDGGVWDPTPGVRTITWSLGSKAPGGVPGAGRTTLTYDATVDDPAIGGATLENTVRVTQTSLDASHPDRRTHVTPPVSGERYDRSDDEIIRLSGASIDKAIAPTTRTIGEQATATLRVSLPAGLDFKDLLVDDLLPNGLELVGYRDADTTCVDADDDPCGAAVAATSLGSATGPPAGTTRIGWWIGDVAPAPKDRTLTLKYDVRVAAAYANAAPVASGALLTNTATVRSNITDEVTADPDDVGDLDPTEWDESDDDTADVRVVEPRLTLDKRVAGQTGDSDALTVQPGDGPLEFTLTVRNDRALADGGWDAHDITVTDVLPAGLTAPTSISHAGTYDADSRTITWKVPGPLAPEADVALTYRVALPASGALRNGDTFTNVADVPEYFGRPKDERDVEPHRTYDDVPEDEVTITVDTPRLQVVKEAVDAGPSEVNQPFRWRVTVTNVAAHARAEGVDVVDLLPPGWTYAGPTTVTGTGDLAAGAPAIAPAISPGGGVARDALRWTDVADLDPGETVVVTFDARPTSAAPAGTQTNDVTVTGDDTGGSPNDADDPYGDDDDAEIPLVKPDLTISKSPDSTTDAPHRVEAGTLAHYTISVTNSATVPARNVVVRDTLPDHLTYGAGSAIAAATGFTPANGWFTETDGAGPTLAWTIDAIPAGGTVTISLPAAVEIGLANGTRLTNVADVRSDEVPTPTDDEGTVTVGSAPDWSTASRKSATPPHDGAVQPTDDIDYGIHVENTGNEHATNVVVTDAIPAHTRYRGGTAAAALPTGVTVEYLVGATYRATEPDDPADVTGLRWTIPRVDVGQSRDVGFGVTVVRPTRDGTTITNVAHLTSDQTPGQTPIGPVDHHVGSAPELTIGKVVDHGDPSVVPDPLPTDVETTRDVPVDGPGIAYTLRVENTGDDVADDVQVRDLVPDRTTLRAIADPPTGVDVACSVTTGPAAVFAPCPTARDDLATIRELRWSAATLTVDHVLLLRFGVDADLPLPVGPDPVVNRATLSADGLPEIPSDPVTTNLLGDADLRLEKTGPARAPAGSIVTYGLRVTNAGPATATPVTVTDQLPAGTTLVDGGSAECRAAGAGVVECAAGALAPGAERTFSVRVRVPVALAGQRLVNRATATSPQVPTPPTHEVTTEVGPAADLSIQKSGPATAHSDAVTTWTLVVRNAGPSDATGVTVTDTLPEGVSLVSTSRDDCTVAGRTVTCAIGSLASGGSTQVLVHGRASASLVGQRIVNVAEVSGDQPDPGPDDNRSSTPSTVVQGAESAVDVRTTKALVSGDGTFGARSVYRITVTNHGTTTATGVKMVDTPSLKVAVHDVKSSQGRCTRRDGIVSCELGTLAPGARAVVDVTLEPRAIGTLVNAASTTGGQPLTPAAVAGARASVPTRITARRTTLRVRKTASRSRVSGGKRLRFTIRVTNGGRHAAANVRVCDRLPRGLSFVSAKGARWRRGQACWTIDRLAAGRSRTLRITVRASRVARDRKVVNRATAQATNARRATARRTVTVRGTRTTRAPGVTG